MARPIAHCCSLQQETCQRQPTGCTAALLLTPCAAPACSCARAAPCSRAPHAAAQHPFSLPFADRSTADAGAAQRAPSEEQQCGNPLKVMCKELLRNRLKPCSSFYELFGGSDALPSHLYSHGKQLQLWSQLLVSLSLQLSAASDLRQLPLVKQRVGTSGMKPEQKRALLHVKRASEESRGWWGFFFHFPSQVTFLKCNFWCR